MIYAFFVLYSLFAAICACWLYSYIDKKFLRKTQGARLKIKSDSLKGK